MIVSVNLSPNDDIEFIGGQIHAALAGDHPEAFFLSGRRHRCSESVPGWTPFFSGRSSSSLRSVFDLGAILRAIVFLWRSDVVLLSSPSIWNIPLAVAASMARCELRGVVHDPVPHYGGLRGALYSFQTRAVVRRSSVVYVFSEFSAGHVAELSTAGRIEVLPLPSPAELEEQANQPNDAGAMFIWFGRNEPYKGGAALPEFARRLAEHGARLLVVSPLEEDDPLRQELESLPNVTLRADRPPTSELADLVSACSYSLLPYLHATQSGLIPFCAALGVPSLVYDVGGLREQIEALDFGLVVDSLATVDIEEVLSRPVDREAVKAAYHERCSAAALREKVVRGEKQSRQPSGRCPSTR